MLAWAAYGSSARSTSRGLCPGCSASISITFGFFAQAAASRSAVCRARTKALVRTTSGRASTAASPAACLRHLRMPSAVSGRWLSSGHAAPRSSAMAWRTR